jgi:glutamyl-tRNA reductase
MQLVILGLNHKTVPVAIREAFAVSAEAIRSRLTDLDDYNGIDEAVILSTCNRSELYAVVNDERENRQSLYDFFFSLTGTAENNPNYFYYYTGKACIDHLLTVAASLDSLVLGEGQILSQVKQAYTIAHECGATGPVLNLLFHQAIATGKRVRTETHIAYNAVSVSYAAVQLAERVFPSLQDRNIMIFGAGQMAELTARNFQGKGAGMVYVVNRHIERARELAHKISGQAVHFRAVQDVAADIDIIITSTGAPHYVLYPQRVRQIMEKRGQRPLLLIDIAVPRDIDPAVQDLQGITLYNIDTLETVVQNNEEKRLQEADKARVIVAEDRDALVERLRYLSMRPVMVCLAQKAERMRSHELKRARTKLPDLDEQQFRIVEHLSHMIVRKILRDPMTLAAKAAETPQESYVLQALSDVFKLDVVRETEHREGKTDHRHQEQ